MPEFASPFAVSSRIINYFDHAYAVASDSNGYQLNACAEADPLRTDGHKGVDYALPVGTPILAAAAGRVIFAGATKPRACPELGGQVVGDSYVSISHTTASKDVVWSEYRPLSRIDVQAGDQVALGQTIGLSGGPGCVVGEGLHFELGSSNGVDPIVIDPYGWEGDAADPWAQDDRGMESFWMWLPGRAPRIQ